MRTFSSFFAFLLTISLAAQTLRIGGLGYGVTRQTLFDDGWTFSHEGKTTIVNLPHDWDIYTKPDPATGATGTGGGWYAAGKGEYKK